MSDMKDHANRIVALCAAVVMVTGLSAFASAADGATQPGGSKPPTPIKTLVQRAKSEDGLNIYGNPPIAYFQPVLDAFKKQYPGIEVRHTDLSDNQVFSKYQSEAAQDARTADLLIASSPVSWLQAEENGVPANVTPVGLENFPSFTNQGHGVYVMSAEPILEVYNTKLLSAAEVPTTYTALAKAAQANPQKYSLVSYTIDNALNYTAIYGLNKILGSSRLWRAYDALAPHTKTFPEGLVGLQEIIQGGASIGYVSSGLGQGVLPNYKGLLAYKFMTDATPLVPRAIAVTAKASSPASAQLFLDFLFSKAGQDALCAAGFEASMKNYQPTNGCTASLTNLYQQVPVRSTYLVPIDHRVLAQQAAITDRWNQAFGR
jgi:iron(III) transport system substrate-binding protein